MWSIARTPLICDAQKGCFCFADISTPQLLADCIYGQVQSTNVTILEITTMSNGLKWELACSNTGPLNTKTARFSCHSQKYSAASSTTWRWVIPGGRNMKSPKKIKTPWKHIKWQQVEETRENHRTGLYIYYALLIAKSAKRSINQAQASNQGRGINNFPCNHGLACSVHVFIHLACPY